jgi:hypothetical protein
MKTLVLSFSWLGYNYVQETQHGDLTRTCGRRPLAPFSSLAKQTHYIVLIVMHKVEPTINLSSLTTIICLKAVSLVNLTRKAVLPGRDDPHHQLCT